MHRRVRRHQKLSGHKSGEIISIHAPREGSDELRQAIAIQHILISIHAPREGSDRDQQQTDQPDSISIHAPREGSDAPFAAPDLSRGQFLSTLPARGATSWMP